MWAGTVLVGFCTARVMQPKLTEHQFRARRREPPGFKPINMLEWVLTVLCLGQDFTEKDATSELSFKGRERETITG